LSENILLLDLGGTNLRVGLGNKELKSIHKISKQKIDSNEELYEIIGDVVRDSKSSEIVMSVAGPKTNNSITMTNRNLIFNSEKLKKDTNTKTFSLLNDWESIGYCLPLLDDSDIKVIKSGNIDNEQTCLAIGPGTGLGFSVLRYINGHPFVSATELGNTTLYNNFLKKHFELDNEEEFKVLESFISGKGLEKIYFFKTGDILTSEEIVESFENDKNSNFVLTKFNQALGKILSDLTLTFLAYGGIYVAGSLMRSINELNINDQMNNSFVSHPSNEHRNILKNTSINLITKEHTPLYGNLNYSIVRRFHE
jgi:glucokinase|tara:strand:- start:1021 stop:1950 length:930 start_codon:yes stop_codon:yes gene_type:complete